MPKKKPKQKQPKKTNEFILRYGIPILFTLAGISILTTMYRPELSPYTSLTFIIYGVFLLLMVLWIDFYL